MSFRKSTIIETAQKLAAKGQYDKAISEWEKLIAETPNDGNIFNAIGDLHLKAGQKQKATDDFINAAEAFQSAGFEMKSIAVYKKALKVDPSRIEIHEKLAHVYTERGLIGNAIDDYLVAAKHYLQQDDFQASLSIYRKISDLDPENIEILIEIADMCQKEGHKEDALVEYKRAVKHLKKADRSSEAEALIQKILELDPSYESEDRSTPQAAAEEAVAEAVNEASDLNAEDLFMQTAHEPPPFESPVQDSEISGLLEPEPELMTHEQTIYASETPLQADETIAEETIEEEPHGRSNKPIESYLTEADVYTQYGLLEKAIHQLDAAAERFPNLVQPHIKLKNLYYQLGDTEKAIEECSILATLYKDNGDDKNRQAILDELMTLTRQSDKGRHESEGGDDILKDAPLPEEAFLDAPPSENSATFEEAEFSFKDLAVEEETTIAADTRQNKPEKDHREPTSEPQASHPDEPSDIEDEIPELDFSADLLASPSHQTGDEVTRRSDEKSSPPASENASPLVHTPEPTQDVVEDHRSDLEIEKDELLTAFDDPALGLDGVNQEADASKEQSVASHTSETAEKDSKERYVDLQAIISEDLEDEENETTLERTIRSFQGKVKEDNTKDIETQYDLGIAYKEMDMITEAIAAFEAAAEGPQRFKDAMSMLAICHRKNGSHATAVKVLQEALLSPFCDQETMITLKYELGLFLEQQGNKKEAELLFDEIYRIDPNFREVSSKRSAFSEDSLGSSWEGASEKEFSKGDSNPKKKDRVSYL